MTPSDRTRQEPRVRFWGERVAGRCRPSAPARPFALRGVRPWPQRPGGTVVTPAWPPAGFGPETGVVLTIPIAETAELVVPSNYGMQLTSGRRCQGKRCGAHCGSGGAGIW
jgi:hypothetical protein